MATVNVGVNGSARSVQVEDRDTPLLYAIAVRLRTVPFRPGRVTAALGAKAGS